MGGSVFRLARGLLSVHALWFAREASIAMRRTVLFVSALLVFPAAASVRLSPQKAHGKTTA